MRYLNLQKESVDLRLPSILPDNLIKGLFKYVADLIYEVQEDEDGKWNYHFLAGTLNPFDPDQSSENMNYASWTNLIHPDDIPLYKKHKETLSKAGTSVNEYRMMNKAGQVWWIRDLACRVEEPTDSKIKIAGVIQYITSQKVYEEEILKRAKLYELLVETSQDGISLLDLDGTILFCNQQKAKMLGYDSPEELIGKSGLILIVPEERNRAVQLLKNVLNGVIVKNFEFKVLKKDGSRLDAEFNVVLIEDEDGKPVQLMDVIRDNTERKQAQQALLETEERFRKAFHLSTDPLCINRFKDGQVIEVNEAFLLFSGYSREELIGHSILEFGIFKNSSDLKPFVKLLLKHQRVNNFEAQFKTRTGEVKIGLISANQLLLHHEPHILSITRDITNRKMYEENLRLMNEQLEQRVRERTEELERANRELESFNYSVSHDLKAPLRGIDGFSYMLLEEYADRLNEQARDYLLRIRKNAQNMGQLIDALLKLSQISRQEINLRQVNLSAIVTGITDEFHSQEFCRQLKFIVARDVIADADEHLIVIALQNLIDNAVKFTAKCGVSIIEFGVINKEKIPTYFVKDNGIGFNNRYREKIFQPFQRLHSSKDFTGTGIGLSIVHRIITKHGGTIWAESEENCGTVFYFTLKK